MRIRITIATLLVISLATANVFAQVPGKKKGSQVLSLDSLRKKEESAKDSMVYTAKHVRYTFAELLKDSTQLIPLDTAITNFQNYSPISQPRDPTIGLGNVGLAYRDLLFNPSKTIGFNAGFHALDRYLLTIDSVRYYRAQSPYTELYYVDGGLKGELFRATHAQNITPGWNFGGNYNRIAANGFYFNQNVDHLNATLFTWYESRNKRYMLLAATVFNNIRAGENGSITNDSVFTESVAAARILEPVRLSALGDNMPRSVWKDGGFFLKQFYYIGKRDSIANNKAMLLPRQRISYAINYTNNQYQFFRSEPDIYGAFPSLPGSLSLTITNDQTQVKRWSNEFAYSFYLRGRSLNFVKNEVKLDVGFLYDWYNYQQGDYETNFNNVTLKAAASYRFSDRASIQVDLQHIAEGRNAGDFLYDAKTKFLLSRAAGQITLGAYLQNKSPEQMFERVNYQFNQWDLGFSKTQINNLSFLYENPRHRFAAKAECFLISNYLYYQETTPKQIIPTQLGAMINMLKFSVAKNFKLGRFHLDNYVVYQKSSDLDLLSTPDLYTYNSFYFELRFFKKLLLINLGSDLRYNTLFEAPAYAINVGQFYRNTYPQVFDSFPVVDIWMRGNLKRVNFFFKYEYVNQGGPFPNGYYTVNRYPMQDAAFKMGISWKFYN